jgi:hypothetical protein
MEEYADGPVSSGSGKTVCPPVSGKGRKYLPEGSSGFTSRNTYVG